MASLAKSAPFLIWSANCSIKSLASSILLVPVKIAISASLTLSSSRVVE
nr:hypothetical protein [endosymbiont of Acanthamoeba sp. UWC8]